jgi:hypothetical protein
MRLGATQCMYMHLDMENSVSVHEYMVLYIALIFFFYILYSGAGVAQWYSAGLLAGSLVV